MCGNPALCSETKVCPVLSVSYPAKRKCLITDTDQPVTDNFLQPNSDLFFIKHYTMGCPVLL